jgi:predicted  nucleic acid-binding Zn-ribbon protein
VEETLRTLYKLQQIDLQLDELDEGSGDLPAEVESLKHQIANIDASIEAENEALKSIQHTRFASGDTIQELRERVKMLNERLRTVRNNKEYEATTSEIEAVEAELRQKETGFTSFDSNESLQKRTIEELQERRDELNRELEEKLSTLTAINETHADELNELHVAKQELVSQLDESLLAKYQHIRTAHNDAVVKLRKGACSGCYRAITPQTIVEMRRSEQLFFCEHCGRIIVDEDIAASVTQI